MADVKCPNGKCNSTNIEATFVCNPCNNPAGTGRTEWRYRVDPATGVPAHQKCPGCGAWRAPAWLTCLDCGTVWKPADDSAVEVLKSGEGVEPTTVDRLLDDASSKS